MLSLTAYFDESGSFTDPNLSFTGMSGFIAPIKVWEDVEEKWNAVVKSPEYNLQKAFHMKYFVHKRQQFNGWSDAKKDSLYKSLVQIIVNSEAVPTGCVVSNAGFSSLSERQQEALRSPYYTALHECIRGACSQVLLFEGNEKVAMTFAAQKDFGTVEAKGEDRPCNAGFTENLYYGIKRNIPEIGVFMGAYAAGEIEDMVPLQVADVLAWEMTKEYENLIGPNRPMRKSYMELMKNSGRRPLVKYLDRLQLLNILRESGCPYEEGMEEIDEFSFLQIAARHSGQLLLNERMRNWTELQQRQPKWIVEEIQRRINLDLES